MSRVVGLLNWYEESPAWLAECVASAARLCDHIIAVDGPYASFPGAQQKPYSGTEQADAIIHTAAGAGIGVTVHAPGHPWWGGEVQKRDTMFRLGELCAADWFLRIDADEVLTSVPADTRHRLATTEYDVAELTLWERDISQKAATVVETGDYESGLRCFFRAIPGIRIEQAHYVVTVPDGGGRRVLCGDARVHRLEPAEPLRDVRLEHRKQLRTLARQRFKRDYYDTVRDLDLEPVAPFEGEQ